MICWICNENEATTKEHIIKKSDIKRAFGNGPFKGENSTVHVKNGIISDIQGANSKKIKYEVDLCPFCNGDFSQPFDLAYDKFIDFSYQNESSILSRRFIDFSEVYGEKHFEEELVNLYKYLVKSFGCRLIGVGKSIPNDMRELLFQKYFKTGLRINFSVNEAILNLSKKDRDSFIGKGDLNTLLNTNNEKQEVNYEWNEHISWLTISYWYNTHPNEKLGSTWVADNQFIYLGSFNNLASID